MKKILIVSVSASMVICALFLWSNRSIRGPLKTYFGINYKIEKELLSYNSKRDLMNDGLSIEVVKLDLSSKEYFQNPPLSFFTEYPKRHFHSGNYDIYKWKKTPVTGIEKFRTNIATLKEDKYVSRKSGLADADEINNYLAYTDTLLRTAGNYYSMVFSGDSSSLYGIDLYVISPKDGIVVQIFRE